MDALARARDEKKSIGIPPEATFRIMNLSADEQ
jgi:hypothetical protein